jgi:hypothetical protein
MEVDSCTEAVAVVEATGVVLIHWIFALIPSERL